MRRCGIRCASAWPVPIPSCAARSSTCSGRPGPGRAGAAQALASAAPDVAAGPLARAASDPHPDVRKAAVIALAPLRAHPQAAGALRAAADDADADVRAYARRAADLTAEPLTL